MEKNIANALTRIPLLSTFSPRQLQIKRLTAGWMNMTYLVNIGKERYVLRMPGEKVERFTKRQNEIFNQKIGVSLGISPEIIFYDEDGLLLTKYINDGNIANPECIPIGMRRLTEIAATLRALHQSQAHFRPGLNIFEMLTSSWDTLCEKKVSVSGECKALVEHASIIRQVLNEKPMKQVPCHNDPQCLNWLDDGVIPPLLWARLNRIFDYAVKCSFCLGVIPPRAILGLW